MTTTPREPAMTAPAGEPSEREQFEAHATLRFGIGMLTHSPEGFYVWNRVQEAWHFWRARAALSPPPPQAESTEPCQCARCQPNSLTNMRMIVCRICGNKRCPHATDHRLSCTNSNASGQEGSKYGIPLEDTTGCTVAAESTEPGELNPYEIAIQLAGVMCAAPGTNASPYARGWLGCLAVFEKAHAVAIAASKAKRGAEPTIAETKP